MYNEVLIHFGCPKISDFKNLQFIKALDDGINNKIIRNNKMGTFYIWMDLNKIDTYLAAVNRSLDACTIFD